MNRTPTISFRLLTAGLFAGPALLGLPTTSAAQSAAEILDRALEHYEQRMEGIDNYTVIQSAEGTLSGLGGLANKVRTTYFEKTMVDGHPVFTARNAGMDSVMQMEAQAGVNSPTATIRTMRDHAKLDGSESIDGRECWDLLVDDPATLAQMQGSSGNGGMTLESMRMCLDKKDYVPLRMVMQGRMSGQDQASPVTMTSTLSDYREVEGLLHPFSTTIEMSGMASGSMSPEDRENAAKQLEEMRAKMKDMPEAQRKMMEKMMGGQLEKLEQMLAEDAITLNFAVEEVKVNAGPPS